jgi:hypothetical protein
VTIAVVVASPDGLVVASDSRTVSAPTGRHRIVSDSAQKVFAPFGRFGVVTYGTAFIGAQTIIGLVDEFIAGRSGPEDVDDLARQLGVFFDERLRDDLAYQGKTVIARKDVWPLGFVVVGYDEHGIGRVREVGVPGPRGPTVIASKVDTSRLGFVFRGQTAAVRRLLDGVDRDAFVALYGRKAPPAVDTAFSKLEYLYLNPITLQDALDFAAFLIRTTIDIQRFSDGTGGSPGAVPACGGALQALLVTNHGAEWIARPRVLRPSAAGRAEES